MHNAVGMWFAPVLSLGVFYYALHFVQVQHRQLPLFIRSNS